MLPDHAARGRRGAAENDRLRARDARARQHALEAAVVVERRDHLQDLRVEIGAVLDPERVAVAIHLDAGHALAPAVQQPDRVERGIGQELARRGEIEPPHIVAAKLVARPATRRPAATGGKTRSA